MIKTALFSALASVASAAGTLGYKKLEMQNFKADANLARNLLAKASSSSETHRGLEDAFEETIVAKHSVIFDGCTNTSSWQDGAYQVIPLVRFTLCPTDSCASGSCSSSTYGEYVVDLPTFLDSYLEAQLEATQYKCEQMREQCGCDEDNNYCLYYCYKNYDDDLDWVSCYNQQDEEARWAECERLEFNDDDGGDRRSLEQGDDGEVEYFMGPVCGSGGDAIYLNVFTDEECQYAASNQIYYDLAGSYHPNMAEGNGGSLVSSGICTSCLEPVDADEQNDDDYYDQDEVTRFCEEIYNGAAKCETYMTNLYSQDVNGCDYIAAIKSNGRARRFLEAATAMTGSSSAVAVVGAMAVLSVAAALIAVKKFLK